LAKQVKKIPDHVRQEYPHLSWRIMTGMRDKFIHDYFGVDVKVAWKTATIDIKNIKPAIKEIIKSYR